MLKLDDLKRGQPVWLIINGEPALWHFVELHGYGFRAAFDKKLTQVHFHDGRVVYETEAEALLALVRRDIKAIKSRTEELQKHESRLSACFSLPRIGRSRT